MTRSSTESGTSWLSATTAGRRSIEIDTPTGQARAHVRESAGARLRGTLVLGHGAGGGIESRDLEALAATLPSAGYRVLLVEQPWRVAGKKIAPQAPVLDEAWRVAVEYLGAAGELAGPLVIAGGRSAGARVACRTATTLGVDGVIALAFPLHPPGRPERSRAEEALNCGVPLLVVQGAKDPFGTPDEVHAALPGLPVVAVPAADHGLRVPKSAPCTQAEALELVTGGVLRQLAEWSRTRSR